MLCCAYVVPLSIGNSLNEPDINHSPTSYIQAEVSASDGSKGTVGSDRSRPRTSKRQHERQSHQGGRVQIQKQVALGPRLPLPQTQQRQALAAALLDTVLPPGLWHRSPSTTGRARNRAQETTKETLFPLGRIVTKA